MLKHYLIATATAVLCSGAVIAGQAPANAQAPQTQPPTEAKATSQPNTVLTGCVYQEKDVPGRAPNIAERAGILEDYILADVTPAQQAAASSATPGAVGTSGTAVKAGAMFKLEFVDDDRLRATIGKRVEVTGRIDADQGDSTRGAATAPPVSSTDKAIGRDRIDLPEFEVVSLREVAGTCPAQPSVR